MSRRETNDSSCIMWGGVHITDTPSGVDRCQPGRQVSEQSLYMWPRTLSSRDLLTFVNNIVDMHQNP